MNPTAFKALADALDRQFQAPKPKPKLLPPIVANEPLPELGISATSVLSIFKALRRKGLVIRELSYPDYQRARYWWPVGLAAELAAELKVTP